MFDFFKKNKPAAESVEEKISAEPAVKDADKIERMSIHTMPERFRGQTVNQDSAKTVGLLIIVGGGAVLLVSAGALYYFLLRKPKAAVIQKPPAVAETERPAVEPAAETPAATTTQIAILPTGALTATTTLATTTPETVATTTSGASLELGLDSDNDGLTDAEEIVLGASSTTPDTDRDGYLDGAELVNLYDPASAGKLAASANVSLYENKTFAYDLLYPAAWRTSVNGGDDSLMFKTGDNQFVQVIVQPNAQKETLAEWYSEQLDILTSGETDRVSGANWQGLKSPDGLNIYLTDKKQNYIISLTYNPGGANTLEYFNIFQMMIKSFNLKD